MQTQHVEAGATIFRAGEPSLAVYVIEDGQIAITVGDAPACIEIARLRAGELFGESGVLEARPRTATATAVTAATLLVTEAETFIRAFGLDNDRALSLVKLLCRRLRDTTLRGAQPDLPRRVAAGTAATDAAHATIRLLPGNERLATEFGMVPVDVRQLPFQVGNRFGGEVLPIASDRNCCIPALGATDLAAPHFEILRRDGRPGIRDLGSRHGTIVNGVVVAGAVSHAMGEAFVPLRVGANDVIAGRANSPFRFRINLLGA